jgi:drug/metabolite transporter superfamily protein YnfA
MGAMSFASIGWGALVRLTSAGLVLAAPGALFVVICLVLTKRVPGLNSAVPARQGALAAQPMAGAQPSLAPAD